MLRLYNTALLPLRLAAELWSRWAARDPAHRLEWQERLGRRMPTIESGSLWLHGSSVGEARLVTALAARLKATVPAIPVAVSAQTPSGRAQLPGPPHVAAAFFAPLDFRPLPGRLLHTMRPRALALVETELWPNLLEAAHALAVPVVILNGRLSARRMIRYRRLRALYAPLLARLTRVGAQSEADAVRFLELGVPPAAVVVTGNVKYDLPPLDRLAQELRLRLQLPDDRAVFIAGSTAAGEEAAVLEGYLRARRTHGQLLLVLAPRYPSRTAEVEQLVRSQGLRVASISNPGTSPERLDVLLVDTLGELPALYHLAWVAFVGGSLVPLGGHNLLEPAAAEVPVLFGPHTENVLATAAALEQAGGGLRVRDGVELGQALEALLGDRQRRQRMAERAARLVQDHRGALERSIALLLSAAGLSARAPSRSAV